MSIYYYVIYVYINILLFFPPNHSLTAFSKLKLSMDGPRRDTFSSAFSTLFESLDLCSVLIQRRETSLIVQNNVTFFSILKKTTIAHSPVLTFSQRQMK